MNRQLAMLMTGRGSPVEPSKLQRIEQRVFMLEAHIAFNRMLIRGVVFGAWC